jgi:hypothetical protein
VLATNNHTLPSNPLGVIGMRDDSIDKLPIETLQQLESQCANVVAEICRSVSCNSALVDAIRSVMAEEDVSVAIDLLRRSDPKVAKRLVTAAFGVLVNTVNLTGIQDELQRRIGEAN